MISTATVLTLCVVAVTSYLLGSCNFAIILTRIFAKDDIRKHGSGNAGMTNVLRTYGKIPAICTALGDFFKAVAAIVLARWLFARAGIQLVDAGYIAGLFVFLGHLFPLYFRFKGGKGVMTTLGIVCAVNPLVFLIIAIIFVPFVFLTRIVSLASIVGAVAFPVLTYVVLSLQGRPALYDTICALVYAAIIIFMHRQNIKRLLSGTESRFGKTK